LSYGQDGAAGKTPFREARDADAAHGAPSGSEDAGAGRDAHPCGISRMSFARRKANFSPASCNLDYRNKRADYVQALLDKLVNWAFAAENFEAAD
jgi:hypothetical protein